MTMTTEWLFDLKRRLPARADHDPADLFEHLSQWIGRSCGARLWVNECESPQVRTGIVLYPGTRFENHKSSFQQVDHVNTKNGPITIVCDTKHSTQINKEK